VPTANEVDDGWTEHQEIERYRRATPLVTPTPRPRRVAPRLDIRAVIASVEADFARWRAEARERKNQHPKP
jgi:hypothetical protein